jgi:4-amino-4-deoxy-L-arabinose transferase-like glycosyltransferase
MDLNASRLASTEKWIVAGLLLLLALASFINLGLQPLYLEEPRRALIALEMFFNDNLMVPTQLGEYYYRKPPVWNWIILGSFKLFGNYSEFAARFFATISFFAMGFLIFYSGKKWVGERFGIFSALLFLVSADLLLYFSLLSEIDLFYALITYSSFLSIFHFHQRRQYFLLFFITYLLGALGVLTKGVPSFLFLGISLLVYFSYNKEFKRLFGWQHFLSIFIFAGIVGAYFYAYSQNNSLDHYFAGIWSQSNERTFWENKFIAFLLGLFRFPAELFINLLPASIFIVFWFDNNFLKTILNHRYIQFVSFLLLANILIYWISPGARQRYIYMLYPMVINMLVYFYLRFRDLKIKQNRIAETLMGILIALSIVVSVALFFIPQFREFKTTYWLAAFSTLAAAGIFYLFLKVKAYRFYALIASFILIRFIFDFTILPYRATYSEGAKYKANAANIVKLAHNQPLKIYSFNGDDLLGLAFYIERQRNEVIEITNTPDDKSLFLVEKPLLQKQQFHSLYSFTFANREYYLVQFHNNSLIN